MKFIILYLILDIIFTQMYKKATFKMEKAGALTILLEWIGCLFCLLLIPFFQWKLPNDILVYFFLFLASFNVSVRISNIDLCVSNPKSYVPFGPLCPSLVP